MKLVCSLWFGDDCLDYRFCSCYSFGFVEGLQFGFGLVVFGLQFGSAGLVVELVYSLQFGKLAACAVLQWFCSLAVFVLGELWFLLVLQFLVVCCFVLSSLITGEGGFGCVYKAGLDYNLVVAIKRLNCECQYAEREYENEVELLSEIHHPKLKCFLCYIFFLEF
ncbi:unnamed protein product [Vicia faba]|uniref:Protein kinase domain-containing protein n=1 Tax=Vicia faba TaxID=3906 RepID=A0AAV0YUC3_VICFA|nr:unnamed protein product [Vicia faba]